MKTSRQMTSNYLALWYLRLNGFLTVANFVLHPDKRGPQRTEADIVAVRFPHRAEFDNYPDADDPRFAKRVARPYFVVAESTRGVCKLNDPWTRSESFLYILRAFGPVVAERAPVVATEWAKRGIYSDEQFDFGLLCFGVRENSELRGCYPKVDQIVWREVVCFFHRRFATYDLRKRDREQWDLVGNGLWGLWKESKCDEQQFWLKVSNAYALPRPGDG